jgi:hypothetical protein
MDAGPAGGGGTEDDSDGCGCTLPGQFPTNGAALWAFTLLGLSVALRRRRVI